MSDDISKYLPWWGQALVTFTVVALTGLAAWKGLTDRKDPRVEKPASMADTDPRMMPLWTMMGPVHEVMQTIHDMAENDRRMFAENERASAALMDIAKSLDEFNRGQAYTHRLLEAILRDSGLTPPPVPTELTHNVVRRK